MVDDFPPKEPIPDSLSKKLGRVAAKFRNLEPAPSTLLEVRAVPTCFVQYDHAAGVGGHPLERVMTLTGPSNHGKTAFALGLLGSFLSRCHYGALLDAECTTPMSWARKMIGPAASSAGFVASRPANYEEAVEAVRSFCSEIAEARERKELPKETTGIIVVDSMQRLSPKALREELEKEIIKKGVDGVSGRAGQIKAAMNGAWLDELIPLMAGTGCTIVLIARETDDPNASPQAKKFGSDWKIVGGRALTFDASLLARITRQGWIYEGGASGEEAKGKPVEGERHRVQICKTKVAGKLDRYPTGYFSTSNGRSRAEGFDPAMDLLELAVEFGIVERKGAWFSLGDERIGQGWQNASEFLRTNQEAFQRLDADVRSKFSEHAAKDTGEVEE